jgi:hypothetical protein
MSKIPALLFGVAVAIASLGGCDDQDAPKHGAKIDRRHGAAVSARLGPDWRSPDSAPSSVWRFAGGAGSDDQSIGRIRAALDANMLPPRDSVNIGDLIGAVLAPRPLDGSGEDRPIPEVSVALTTAPWNEDAVLLWITVAGRAAGTPAIKVEFNPRTIAAWRPLGDPGDLPQDRGGRLEAAALYEIAPRPETAGAAVGLAAITVKDGGKTDRLVMATADAVQPIDAARDDLRFAVALAGFGALLRGDPAMRDLSCRDVIDLARSAAEPDPDGRRAQAIDLMERAEPLIDLPPREPGPPAASEDANH